jgi:hypothetical protein
VLLLLPLPLLLLPLLLLLLRAPPPLSAHGQASACAPGHRKHVLALLQRAAQHGEARHREHGAHREEEAELVRSEQHKRQEEPGEDEHEGAQQQQRNEWPPSLPRCEREPIPIIE